MNMRRQRSEFEQQFGTAAHRNLIREQFPACRTIGEDGATLIKGGEDNINLLLRDELGNPRWVARHYLISSPAKIAGEMAFVSVLVEQGFPTPAPVPTLDGSLFLDRGQEPTIAVFPFAEGIVESNWSVDRKRKAASLLARIHKICTDLNFTIGATKPRLDILRSGPGKVAAVDFPGHEILTAAVDAFMGEFETQRADFEALPWGPVHHDLNYGNVIWANDQIAALIDFDECHDAPFIMDLAAAFHYLAIDNTWQFDVGSCAAILEGYQQVRKLSPKEQAMLPLAWDLLNLTAAVEFIVENYDWLGHANECRSLAKFYLPLKAQLAPILMDLD